MGRVTSVFGDMAGEVRQLASVLLGTLRDALVSVAGMLGDFVVQGLKFGTQLILAMARGFVAGAGSFLGLVSSVVAQLRTLP